MKEAEPPSIKKIEPDKLPVKREKLADNERLELTSSEILKKNTQFLWEHPCSMWGGLSRQQLIGLVGEIAQIIKYRSEYAQKTNVIFGDHIVAV